MELDGSFAAVVEKISLESPAGVHSSYLEWQTSIWAPVSL